MFQAVRNLFHIVRDLYRTVKSLFQAVRKMIFFSKIVNLPQKKHPKEKQGNPIEISKFVFHWLLMPSG